MDEPATYPNPDLELLGDNKPAWNQPRNRRRGFHELHRIARYGVSFRARRVLALETRADLAIAARDDVGALTSLPWFSAMVVARGPYVLFERYASDFGPERPHSIQSITKTTLNLIIGRLVEQGRIDLARPIGDYVPEIGSGYASATVQQALDMDVANDYTEDYADTTSTVFAHEEAMGLRLPADPAAEMTMHGFLPTITSADTTNRAGAAQYKSANTDVLGWVAERAGGRPLRALLADITDAAGFEHALNITTDRDGVPTMDGGASLTARDLARLALLFVRRGTGVAGEPVGSPAFIEATLGRGVPMPPPRDWLRYSNQTNTDGRFLGHGGYGGQYMVADLTSGVVGVFFSVLEDKDAYDMDYYPPIIRMLADIGRTAGP
jgi:CubicO group peptidase (beta-lactamase class C family)